MKRDKIKELQFNLERYEDFTKLFNEWFNSKIDESFGQDPVFLRGVVWLKREFNKLTQGEVL